MVGYKQNDILKFFKLLIIFSLFLQTLNANDKIKLQLKWFSSFQFAGYYMAKEKGFYNSVGLDVDIIERNPDKNHIKQVINNEAEYGIADSTILLYRAAGDPVKIVASIFQHSPVVYISKRSSDIISPFEMKGKILSYQKGLDDAPLIAMLNNAKISERDYTYDSLDFTSQELIDNKVDVMIAYLSDQPYFFKKKGIDINIINPLNYGFDFYGDNLFTTEKEIVNNPKRVVKFKKASIKGWEYALNNIEETVNILKTKYGATSSIEHLLYEAEVTRQMILPSMVSLGSTNRKRYYRIAQIYETIGKAKKKELDNALDNLIYQEDNDEWSKYIYIISILFVITLGVGIILYLINKKLHKLVNKKTEELLEYKEALFIKSKAVMLLIEPKTGKIINCNSAAIVFYKYTHEEITSKFIFDVNQLSKEEIDEELKTAKEEERSHFYFKHKLKDGDIKDVEVHTGPINLNGKQLLYSIIHDITEQRKQEKLMREQSKLAAMGEMIGNIAHQWRQPLSVISTASTGIIMQKEFDILDEKELIQTCNTINDNAQYLSKTIDDFKNFIIGNRSKKIFNLKSEIESFLHLIEGSSKNHNIKMILDIDNTIVIDSYENELTQCLINIFNNAKDALKENTSLQENKFIFISTSSEQDRAIIKIKDNAGGIADDVITHIFEPYFTTKHQTQGTGLGLHMTYNLIVDGMIGTIEANNVTYLYKNTIYVGAEFTIILPMS